MDIRYEDLPSYKWKIKLRGSQFDGITPNRNSGNPTCPKGRDFHVITPLTGVYFPLTRNHLDQSAREPEVGGNVDYLEWILLNTLKRPTATAAVENLQFELITHVKAGALC